MRIAGILAAAGFALATPALGVRMGELATHSALGEPLDATVALRPSRGETPVPGCFRLGSARSTDLLVEAGATVAVESQGTSLRLRLRTRAPIQETALQFRLNAGCPGGRSTTRDYDLLLSPRIGLARPAAAAPAPVPRAAEGQRSRPGDTLASIARAIYPNNADAREAYVQALRAENPALAGLAPDAPIPDGSAMVLPDLRRFAMGLPPSQAKAEPRPVQAQPPPASAPPPKREARPPRKETAPAPAPAPEPRASEPAPAPPSRAAQPAPRARGGGFELRLSAPEMDLSRSRGIDDGQRSRLRERLLILDADDQVAALLAMRHNLKQLEGRVAELQLKLSTLPPAAAASAQPAKPPAPPPSLPAAAPTPQPAKAEPGKQPVAPKPEEPSKPVEPSKPAEPPKAVDAPKPVEPPKAAEPAPAAEVPRPAAPLPAKAPAKAAPTPPPAPPGAPATQDDWMAWALGALALAAVVAAGAVAWRARKRAKPEEAAPAPPESTLSAELDEAEAMMRGAAAGAAAPGGPTEHRVVASSDADLATSVPGADPAALRRRYIEERFPEISSGTIEPANADSVVKGARLFYEDGALARAVELLQFAVEERPAELKPWLALFEIFRLERLSGEFAELARRFRDHHGSSDYWRKVQFIGREIDPQNPLYREGGVGTLETIAFPAGKPPEAITFDPLAENWLNAPMDFTTDALVASLRAGLLADAGVNEPDLVADPMPALKNVEMFNVA